MAGSLIRITGASSGIGAALARTLPWEGARVIGVSRRVPPVGEHLQLDLTDASSWARLGVAAEQDIRGDVKVLAPSPPPPTPPSASARPGAASGEDRQPAQQRPFVLVEQLVAPVEGDLHASMTLDGRVAVGGQKGDASVESGGDVVQRHRRHPGCHQLDRERDALRPPAYLGDGPGSLGRERERRVGRPGPLREQRHGLGVGAVLPRRTFLEAVDEQRSEANSRSPDVPSASSRPDRRRPPREPL